MATLQSRNEPSSPPSVKTRGASPLAGAWWKVGLVGALMCYVIYGAFFIAQGAAGFGQGGDKARIVFFHVPCAVLSSVCYFVGMAYAIGYLMKRRMDLDAKSAAAMEQGFLFCVLATITGSIFAGVQWGSFWNWDPRETSIVIMLLLYAAYLVLRGGLSESREKRARLSAAYAVIALIPAQYLIWAVPRLLATNHPTQVLTTSGGTSLNYKLVLYPSFLAFTMLFVWMFQLRVRLAELVLRREERRGG